MSPLEKSGNYCSVSRNFSQHRINLRILIAEVGEPDVWEDSPDSDKPIDSDDDDPIKVDRNNTKPKNRKKIKRKHRQHRSKTSKNDSSCSGINYSSDEGKVNSKSDEFPSAFSAFKRNHESSRKRDEVTHRKKCKKAKKSRKSKKSKSKRSSKRCPKSLNIPKLGSEKLKLLRDVDLKDQSDSDDIWVEKVVSITPSPAKVEQKEFGAKGQPSESLDNDDNDANFIGPRLIPNEIESKSSKLAINNRLMRFGEGEAMAKYIEAGRRIPRRGEVGYTDKQIEEFHASGYIMSGSRHKKFEAVRLRKEGQLYKAKEDQFLQQFINEQKKKRETEILAQFQKNKYLEEVSE